MIAVMPKTNPRAGRRPTDQKPIRFESHASAVLSALQSAMARLVSSIPAAGRIERTTDLQRALGIHSKLAWQTFRVATATNPIEEGRAVPGATAMERFLEAAQRRGVPAEVIAEVRRAFDQFEELVRVHGGNRAAFDSMIGGLASEGADQLDLVHKRAAFRAYAHFLGARAKAMLGCSIYQPSASNADLLDWVSLKGLFGLSTQRRDAAWELSSLKGPDEIQALHAPDHSSPGLSGIALFREFCSSPLPPMRVVPREEGRTSVLVDGLLIDHSAAINLVLGPLRMSGVERYRTPENDVLLTSIAVRTPSEVLIHDVLVPEGLFPSASPRVEMFHTLAGGPFARMQPPHDRLAMRESVIYVGRGPDAVSTDDIPGYAEMLSAAFSRVGWDGSRFDVYRCRVEYPVVPSTVRVMFDLPSKTS